MRLYRNIVIIVEFIKLYKMFFVNLANIKNIYYCRKKSNETALWIQVIILDTNIYPNYIYTSSVHSSAVSEGRADYNIPFLLSHVVL